MPAILPDFAGKSNLMDAISFVLGIKARELRGNNFKALLIFVFVDSSGLDPRSKHWASGRGARQRHSRIARERQ